jgi:hypothetical protein
VSPPTTTSKQKRQFEMHPATPVSFGFLILFR